MSPRARPLEIFLSHVPEDEALRVELEQHLGVLRQSGVITIFHLGAVAPGEDARAVVRARLARAEIVLLLISAAYLASDTWEEVAMARGAGHAGVIPILLRASDWTHAPFGALRPLPTDRRPITLWSDRNEAFTDVVRGLREVITGVTPGRAVPASALFEGPRAVPVQHVPHFHGRASEIATLGDLLALPASRAACVVVVGPGGVGKTSLVQEFAATAAMKAFPEGSIWLDAGSLSNELARVARGAGWRGERDPTPEEANAWLSRILRDRRVLIVLDNVDPAKANVGDLPIPGGLSRTVITSRARMLGEDLGKPAETLRNPSTRGV